MKKERKIKPVVDFNDEHSKSTVPGEHHVRTEEYIPGHRTAGYKDSGKGEHASGFNNPYHLKGSDHDIDDKPSAMLNPRYHKQDDSTAVPGTEATYNEDIGVVITVDPLVELEKKIKHGLIENTIDLFEAALQTMRAKNADYSGTGQGEDAMRNFFISADVAKIKMSKGILVRLMDKMTRVGNIIDSGNVAVKSESVLDTLQDAINYCAILHFGLLIEQRDELVKHNEVMEAYREEKGD